MIDTRTAAFMNLHVNYHSCPACKSESTHPLLSAQDHTVSQEYFTISTCDNCGFRFTADAPTQEEIYKYYQSSDYISHSDTKKGLVNFIYHAARFFTMMSKESLVKKAAKRQVGMLLDIGSGTGTFLHTMEKAGWSVVGLEPDAEARALAVKKYNSDIYPSDELFRLPEATYNAITMWHVLEHVHQLDEYIVRIKELLAPEGRLIVAVPNCASKDCEIYGANWAAYDVPRHLYHFSPQSMRTLMQRHGLKVIDTKRMWLDSFYIAMLSEKYIGGNIIKAVWNGFRSNLVTFFNKEKCSSVVYVIEAE
ncbi:MAG: methyltransferase domain-containing protein [Lacibacter sp.]